MKGNFHVQFLGEGVAATSPPYPTPGWATTQVYPAQPRSLPSGAKRFVSWRLAHARDLLMDLSALVPVLAALGGAEAVAETFRAIQDVGRWWP